MTQVCTTLTELKNRLATKPRTQAHVYVGAALHRHLARTDMQDLRAFLGPNDTLELNAADCITPPELAFWVCHVKYDSDYETPDEFGDPMVDWNDSDHEDIRSVASL